jgi:putative ABC transport system permease protein
VGAGLAAAVVIGGCAGLYPALRAARLSPTEALRTA